MSYWDINAEHWRKRAASTRAAAEEIFDRDTKERMLRIAKEYEQLALPSSSGRLLERSVCFAP